METVETVRVPKIVFMLEEVREDIARGVAYLNEHAPGWLNEIDLERLELNSMDHCVLGQLTIGDYVVSNRSISWLCEHGFWFTDGTLADYAYLTAEWVRCIEELRRGNID